MLAWVRDVTPYRCLSRSGPGRFADCFQTSCVLLVSDPGDPVEMYADIEGESDIPSRIGGCGAAVTEVNIVLSLTNGGCPKVSEMISADSPKSSVHAPTVSEVMWVIWEAGGVLTWEKRHDVTLVAQRVSR